MCFAILSFPSNDSMGRLERNDCDGVSPVFWRVVCPNQYERLNNEAKWRILRNHQQDPRAVVPFIQKYREVPRHRTLVVADKNSAFGGGTTQHGRVVQVIE